MMEVTLVWNLLQEHYGNLHWWPGDTPEEVIIGAILTQNTAWSNVEKAINKLKENNVCSLEGVASLNEEELGVLIRSSGFFRRKAKILNFITNSILDAGGLEGLKKLGDKELDEYLMGLYGVGRETCDSIMIYALDRKKFVIDKYTNRIFKRLGIIGENQDAESLRDIIEKKWDVEDLKNFHGMLVNLAKDYCKTDPVCSECALRINCNYWKETTLP